LSKAISTGAPVAASTPEHFGRIMFYPQSSTVYPQSCTGFAQPGQAKSMIGRAEKLGEKAHGKAAFLWRARVAAGNTVTIRRGAGTAG
jgi:hypothetical protein